MITNINISYKLFGVPAGTKNCSGVAAVQLICSGTDVHTLGQYGLHGWLKPAERLEPTAPETLAARQDFTTLYNEMSAKGETIGLFVWESACPESLQVPAMLFVKQGE
jgi:hypothetical protein